MSNITSEANKRATEEALAVSPRPSAIKRAQWRKHVNDWKASGLSQLEFCKSRGLKSPQLSYYHHAFSRADAEHAGESAPAFTPVRVAPKAVDTPVNTHPPFRLHLPSGCVLDIPAHYDDSTLRQLVTLLGVSTC